VTATNSSKPIFNGKYLKPGVHINAIGTRTPPFLF
jgi:ornithine cyclodeaminase/alanine dehydrogenase-like protein (mu-crystallin family)